VPGLVGGDASVVILAVREEIDVFTARRRTGEFAEAMGFGRVAVSELVIASSELAWNIVKYTPGGDITLSSVERDGDLALEIAARDTGPPFRNFRAATVDGNDDQGPIDPVALWKRRGIGGGLGAVLRFTDELVCRSVEGGKVVVAVRYLSRQRT